MPRYQVRVVRTGHSEAFVEVLANNMHDAMDIAFEEVADVDFKEYDQKKSIKISEIKEI